MSFCFARAARYGDTADECGEAHFLCGKSLLELARSVNAELNNFVCDVYLNWESKISLHLTSGSPPHFEYADGSLCVCVCVLSGWRTVSLVMPWRESQRSQKKRSSSLTRISRAPTTSTVSAGNFFFFFSENEIF